MSWSKNDWLQFGMGVFTMFIVIFTFSFVMFMYGIYQSEQMNLTRDNCCNGSYCSDTWYDVNAGECEYIPLPGVSLGILVFNSAVWRGLLVISLLSLMGCYFIRLYRRWIN